MGVYGLGHLYNVPLNFKKKKKKEEEQEEVCLLEIFVIMFQNSVIYTLTGQKVISHKPLANKRRSFVVIPAPFCHILLFATKDEGGRTDHVKASDWVMAPWLRPSFLLSVSWSVFFVDTFFLKAKVSSNLGWSQICKGVTFSTFMYRNPVVSLHRRLHAVQHILIMLVKASALLVSYSLWHHLYNI